MNTFRDWLISGLGPESAALTVLILSAAAAFGLALGSVRVRGASMGIGGVLFAGLALGKVLGPGNLNPHVLEFARDFGLILFVYTIGVQAGPGFMASLRRQGLPLNLLAAAVVLLGVAVTVVVAKIGGVPMSNAVGLFAGATTNTPSLAAASQALRDAKGAAGAALVPGTVAGYAIAYPFGIVGIILTMLLLRAVFRVNLRREAAALAEEEPERRPLARVNLQVDNPNLEGRRVGDIPVAGGGDVVISRVQHDGQTRVARPDTVVHRGDHVLAVGPSKALDDLRVVVGTEIKADLAALPGAVTTRRVLVTQPAVLGQTVDQLDLAGRLGVRVTRVRRGEVEVSPSPQVPLQFGDTLTVVGENEAIRRAAAELGDSLKQLNHPQIVSVFVGIALGVVLGSLPLRLPGVPAPVKLGLAGGPLIAAILLSRLGHAGPLIWHMPVSANFALRELGIALFLACVGVNAGGTFFETLAGGPGLYWMACGAAITAVPILTVGLFARAVLKMNYMTLCGLLSGSMTDPPALAFATAVTGSEVPNISYAAVYPLVMLLRVVAAQVLVLAFAP
jgi:putative transport protein